MIKLKLKAARINAGLLQKEVAKKLNVTPQTILNWENGKRFPKQPMIEKLCELYSISYDDLDFTP